MDTQMLSVNETLSPVVMKQLVDLCDQWHITTMALFGSITTPRFSSTSDIDMLVSFDPSTAYSLFDLMKINDQLENIFERRVDLLTYQAVEEDPNFLRRESILNSAKVIYVSR
jgi:hypothetical protein